MAAITAELDLLRVRLTRGERWAALRRTDLTVPWDQVRSVEAVADPFRLVRGLRAPGLAVPWRTKIGTWRGHGRKTFAVTRKGLPGLRITLRGSAFDQILLSVANPVPLQSQITARLTPDPAGTRVERVVAFPAGDRSQATLAGTVLLPPAGRPVLAAAVLITGSGPLDRDANAPRAALGLGRELAQSLAAAGSRACAMTSAASEHPAAPTWPPASPTMSTTPERPSDRLPRSRNATAVPIFVIGHSEGAMIATALAAEPGTALAAGPAPHRRASTALHWRAPYCWPARRRPASRPSSGRRHRSRRPCRSRSR